MTRLTLVIGLVFLTLAVPLGWFILRSYESLTREETATMRFVAVTLFDAMEEELAQIVTREEARSVDAWLAGETPEIGMSKAKVDFEQSPWIVGYLQHNPDGEMDMPVQEAMFTAELRAILLTANEEIGRRAARDDGFIGPKAMEEGAIQVSASDTVAKDMEMVFQPKETVAPQLPNDITTASPSVPESKAKPSTAFREQQAKAQQETAELDATPGSEAMPPPPKAAPGKKGEKGLLDQVAGMLSGRSRDYLGQDRQRTQIVTQDQARNIARLEQRRGPVKQQRPDGEPSASMAPSTQATEVQETDLKDSDEVSALAQTLAVQTSAGNMTNASLQKQTSSTPSLDALLEVQPKTSIQVEVAPLQSMVLSGGRIFLYRRVVLGGNIYRQGLLIDGTKFLQHLMDTYFRVEQLPNIASLVLSVNERGRALEQMADGLPDNGAPALQLTRQFPRPFTFLEAELLYPTIPASEARATLNALAWVLAAVMVGGFVAVHRSARALNELSQRRAGFVSSVTHELKTPLTTIRMYAEMLEQGMVPTREREEEYLRTVGTEAERLSRLIGNVLEFSKLEKRTRRFEMQQGDLGDVLDEVRRVLGPTLAQEAFELEEDIRLSAPFAYDREAMVQILLNLVENSIKFCKESPIHRITIRAGEVDGKVVVCVQDTGPGVPPAALSRIFNDFYRVDDSLTRKTKGTGLGLALVKRLADGMGGKVWARNVEGGGLMICIRFS